MTKDKTIITLKFPNGQSETLELDSCIFGGVLEGSEFPCGGYHGDLKVESSFVPMVHVMRAFIKICEEQNMSLEQSQFALEFCMKEAIKKEKANDPVDNVDLDTHMIKMKMEKGNRNVN